jgi:choline kinase
MKALILNSGLGRRMGVLASEHPKCMTEISNKETILSRQLKLIASHGITEVVMTTGLFDDVLINYCKSLDLPLQYTFVKNERYMETNYIYSIYCARNYLMNDGIIMMHGDLVFEGSVLDAVINSNTSCMVVSSTSELPEKDFKAVVNNGRITSIGVEFFNNAMAAQPLYKLKKEDWNIWLDSICRFVETGKVDCYAENAFNEVSDQCIIHILDIKKALCSEIDTPEDLAVVSALVKELENRTVYMCFSTDIIHSGHIAIINKADCNGMSVWQFIHGC